VLYGTAQAYEINSGLENGGTVFSLTPPAEAGGPWVEATVYNFPPSGKQYPATVTLGANGVLYGTTNLGYNPEGGGMQGGTVFSLAPPSSPGGSWTQATLWTFPAHSGINSSYIPNGPLIFNERNGALFGATGYRFTKSGTLFELLPPASGSSAWTKRVLNDTDTLDAAVCILKNRVLYGMDAAVDIIWSLVP
jgi:hypothetical protein